MQSQETHSYLPHGTVGDTFAIDRKKKESHQIVYGRINKNAPYKAAHSRYPIMILQDPFVAAATRITTKPKHLVISLQIRIL